MKTLKELFDEHGSVWLAVENKPNDKYFRPIGYSEDKSTIIGEHRAGFSDFFSIKINMFILYTPPKNTVRKYLWAAQIVHSPLYLDSKFMTEDEARIFYGGNFHKRMDELFIDVEE